MSEWKEDFSDTFSSPYWYRDGQNGIISYIDPNASELIKQGWSEQYSATYRKPYWHNCYTNEVLWTSPPLITPHVAIIVPFRDLHIEQKRSAHLKLFLEYMTEYMRSLHVKFSVYIIEQSDDGKKFNRGKLLNIGFDIARKDGYNTFIFHDVDLLPSLQLGPSYRCHPTRGPLHIARVWNRYNDNKDYFGGVVSFTTEQFEALNGYPNNYWGWGGEDDELMNRMKTVRIPCVMIFMQL